jgi:GNAT superfamily N-acetyltransferase
MTTEVRVDRPMPTGVTLRPYRGETDVPEMARILNAALADAGLDEFFSPEQLAIEMRPTRVFDPDADAVIAEAEGAMVAFARHEWVDTTDGGREHRIWGEVDLAWRRQGIGSALLARNIERARAVAASHDTDRPRLLGSFTAEGEAGCRALLTEAGFHEARWFFHMIAADLATVPSWTLPDGVEIRPVTPDQARQIFDADVEAFLDHWGGFDASDEAFANWLSDPDFDPSLWVVAFAGDEVAGASINAIRAAENEALGVNRGWLESVFVRRPWRRQGLARAIVGRSLELLRDRGVDAGILGVDADNPTGALGVYTDNGFVVSQRLSAWQRPLEIGHGDD